MTSMEEWQLDAIESVMRRCDVLSDFSTEQIARTLEQMGFTIARRESKGAADPVTQKRERSARKRTMRNPRGHTPSLVIVDEVPAAFFQRCNEFATHLPHGVCPGKESTEERDTQIPSDEEPACTITKPHERHVWEQGDQVYGCPGVTGDEVRNLSEAFEKTPIDSTWIRKVPSQNQSNECRVIGVYFKLYPEGKQFFVNSYDTWDDAHSSPLGHFLDIWERV